MNVKSNQKSGHTQNLNHFFLVPTKTYDIPSNVATSYTNMNIHIRLILYIYTQHKKQQTNKQHIHTQYTIAPHSLHYSQSKSSYLSLVMVDYSLFSLLLNSITGLFEDVPSHTRLKPSFICYTAITSMDNCYEVVEQHYGQTNKPFITYINTTH